MKNVKEGETRTNFMGGQTIKVSSVFEQIEIKNMRHGQNWKISKPLYLDINIL